MGESVGRRPVVAGVDGSDSGVHAVRWAAAEAVRRQVPLRLVAAYAWPSGGLVGDPGLGVDPRAVLRNVVLGHLDVAARAAAQVAGDLEVERVDVAGFPEAALEAESRRAELVVLGSRGLGGFVGLLVGSVAVALAAHAECPVVVVRGREPDGATPLPEPVVVGVDGSAGSDAALAFAFEAAALRRAPLVAVHAWWDLVVDPTMGPAVDWDAVESHEHEVLAERLAGWAATYPDVPVRRVLVRDRPARALVEESSRAQLVVVGSRGRGGLRGMLLGSVSQALLHHAHCPVAVVRKGAAVQDTA